MHFNHLQWDVAKIKEAKPGIDPKPQYQSAHPEVLPFVQALAATL